MKATSKYLSRIISIVSAHPSGITPGAVGRQMGVSINIVYSAIASSSVFAEDDDGRLLLVNYVAPIQKQVIIKPSHTKPRYRQVQWLLFGGAVPVLAQKEKTLKPKARAAHKEDKKQMRLFS